MNLEAISGRSAALNIFIRDTLFGNSLDSVDSTES